MSVAIRPATVRDIEPVCRFLHAHMNRRIAPERWARLMTYDWLAEKPDLGLVACDGDRVAGFVGKVHADRDIPGRRERVVNICAWYLHKDYRGGGLGTELMRQATADPAMSYAILTSSSRTPPILGRVGYRILDSDRLLWRTTGAAAAPTLRVERDPRVVAARATPAQRRVLADHAELPIAPMLFSDEGARCLAVFAINRKDAEILWFDALHLGDPRFFAAHAQSIADAILPEPDAILAIDRRLLAGHPPLGADAAPLPVPRFFKSTRLEPAEIDNLYSELQLMNLKLD